MHHLPLFWHFLVTTRREYIAEAWAFRKKSTYPHLEHGYWIPNPLHYKCITLWIQFYLFYVELKLIYTLSGPRRPRASLLSTNATTRTMITRARIPNTQPKMMGSCELPLKYALRTGTRFPGKFGLSSEIPRTWVRNSRLVEFSSWKASINAVWLRSLL